MQLSFTLNELQCSLMFHHLTTLHAQTQRNMCSLHLVYQEESFNLHEFLLEQIFMSLRCETI